jgi:hypothetical protein
VWCYVDEVAPGELHAPVGSPFTPEKSCIGRPRNVYTPLNSEREKEARPLWDLHSEVSLLTQRIRCLKLSLKTQSDLPSQMRRYKPL